MKEKRHITHIMYTAIALLGLLWLASCGGDSGPGGGIDTRANMYSTSAVSNFGGPDADDVDARSDARALMVNRTFDFTESGYVLGNGLVSTAAGGNVNFGNGTGTVAYTGDSGSVSMGIAPASPDYSNVDLNGSFSKASAQSAIDNAGNTFTVNWQMSYTYNSRAYEIHFDSTLTGSDFRQL
ncbi:MAG: hypothetical protein H7A35_08660 [Planctomycetales bacterium]|nr:hypothetical protein [bacterium]UNM06954.1 MAG: hypothetical protein H7A35_08660 [Planctomycetales bacterium]